jgi:plasmid maintenance system antidote protein VapI
MRRITADTALRPRRCFGIHCQVWLNLQNSYFPAKD